MGFSVYKPADRKFYYVQWRDEKTEKMKTKSTKQTSLSDAYVWLGANKEKLLKEEPVKLISDRLTWDKAVERFVEQRLKGKSIATIRRNKSSFKKLKDSVTFTHLDEVDDALIEKFTNKLYSEKLSGFTIRTHLMIIRKMLRWCRRKGYLGKIPHFEMPGSLEGIRGRAITLEEFERMIKAIPEVVGEHGKDSWEFLLYGLWWSGLRISEAMELHWTDDSNITVDFSREYPMFCFQAHAQKNRKLQYTPMAPEFVDHIKDQRRRGYVFNPLRRAKPYHLRMDVTHVGKIITKIGEEAKVVVSKNKGKVKYASAHDLRRSFGDRWSWKVDERELQELMRHESIETTKKFYAKRDASRSAKKIWDFFTNTSTNTLENEAESGHSEQAEK